MSREQLQAVTAGIVRLYAGWAAGAPIAQMRTEWDAYLAQPRLEATMQDVDANGVACRWVCAPGVQSAGVVMYFHGGGYQIGSLDSHHNAMAALSRHAGCAVLGVGYRKAPEHRFPAPVDDAMAAWRWLLARGNAASGIALAGDSAGGGLAVALTTLLRDRSMALPAAVALLSPWVDMEATGESCEANAARDPVAQRSNLLRMARTYLGRTGNPDDPLASPLHANLARLPPMLVQAGGDEVLLDDARRLAEHAKAQGVAVRLSVWEGMVHTFQLFPGRLDEADAALAEVGAFLAEHLNIESRKQA